LDKGQTMRLHMDKEADEPYGLTPEEIELVEGAAK
jgi:hypothetical protein